MPLSPDELRELPHVISEPRFATYLREVGGDRTKALNLYRWNLEVSAAFMVPLQVYEVAIRNGVAEALEKVHGANWPWSPGFIRSLPVPKRAHHYHPGDDLIATAKRQPTAGKVVAELKSAFWQNMFTRGQDQRLWLAHFRASFPGVPAQTPISLARANAYGAIKTIREFRNRIAHYEPIFMRNIAKDYDLIHEVISWRSPVAAAWMDRVQSVRTLLTQRP